MKEARLFILFLLLAAPVAAQDLPEQFLENEQATMHVEIGAEQDLVCCCQPELFSKGGL